ncbi:MAG: glycosyltransferase family 4 protein [Armatimonadota bacterium]|nr:glycosyltransferase family 4 protein [Armatimonadota bacterium]
MTRNRAARRQIIGIDCRTVLAHKTGDRTYTLNLLHGLAQLHLDPAACEFHLLLDAPDEEQIIPHADYFKPVVLRASNSRLWTLIALPLYARRARLDLVHVHYIAPPLLPCPFVTTIHDVVWRAMPETFPPLHRAIMNCLMPGTARRAARIITESEAARQDITNYLRVAPEKISITSNAVEPRYLEPVSAAQITAVRGKYGIGETPYVLSVGVLQPRKNVPRLIEAFEHLRQRHPDWPHRLVIVGKRGWGLENAEGATGKAELIYTGYVPDEDLPALYAGAEVFAYPSLYEGFGLPILEAMACGCPVLTSNLSSMPEVAGDAAQLVDPFSVAAIRDGLEQLLSDQELRERLRQRGRERATQFTAERQAAATLEVYRSVIKTP